MKYTIMNTKDYKDCQNNYRYLNKYEDDEFIIDKKIKRNYRRYKQKHSITTDTDSFEEEKEKPRSSMKNKSVKKVIEKFNRLSCYNSLKPPVNSTLVIKQPKKVEISTHEIIKDKSEKVSEYDEDKKSKRSIKEEEIKSSSKNSEKSIVKYPTISRKIRYSENMNNSLKMDNNDFFNIFKVPDEYIRFIDKVRRRNIIKYTPKNTLDNLQLSKNELKHFKSTKTQTSPYSSNTNILINVYNAPATDIYDSLNSCNKSLQLRVYRDNQFRLSIMEEPHKFQNSSTKEIKKKKSVKNCVQEFEEFIMKKGLNNVKNMDKVSKTTKYKSNHLTEDTSATLLSPKAKSVPF